jgi:hypothetical protein
LKLSLTRSTLTMLWIWPLLATTVAAASVDELVGTWTTKSRNVFTGPVRVVIEREKNETNMSYRAFTIHFKTDSSSLT